LALSEGIIEVALPDVQPDLPEDGEADYDDHGTDLEIDLTAV